MQIRIEPLGKLRGEITVPGDKSISHRSIMLASLAKGRSEIKGFLFGEDCLSTVKCFRQLGINITCDDVTVVVEGKGLDGLQEPEDVLNVGNSGTTIRLMSGILSGQNFTSVITGDESIRKRPMARVTVPLQQMGAQIIGRQNGKLAPLAIRGGNLTPIDYVSPIASAQVKSSIMLAGLFAEGETSVTEPQKSRDHTERMMQYFGGEVRTDGLKVTVKGRPKLEGRAITVPGDISSAAFFLVAGCIVPESEILVRNVGINPTRNGVLDVLQAMGADMEIMEVSGDSVEPMADILVRYRQLRGTEIKGDLIPRLIDEIPILAVAAALAEGETVVRDAAELRVKETDRIAAMTAELRKMGVEVEELDDGMVIRGGAKLRGATCESYGDHRIAMAMAIAGLVAEEGNTVTGASSIAVSFPGFAETLEKLTGKS